LRPPLFLKIMEITIWEKQSTTILESISEVGKKIMEQKKTPPIVVGVGMYRVLLSEGIIKELDKMDAPR